jgi:hypothetical protein
MGQQWTSAASQTRVGRSSPIPGGQIQMISARKPILLCIGVAMVAGVTAFATSVPDQQIATWTCYYQVNVDSVFTSKGSWMKDRYTLSVSGGNLIDVDHDDVNNISTTETVSLGKIKDVKGEIDAGHYFIIINSYGDDVTSQIGLTSDQEDKMSLEFLGTDEATYNAVKQKLLALVNK